MHVMGYFKSVKGIVLAGGTGSRLWPVTKSVSKQLLPVYDKPMIYYPLATLMLAGIQKILVITTPEDEKNFTNLLGNGENFGIELTYAQQDKPRGLAEAYIIAENFLAGDSSMMILGDNIFHGPDLDLNLNESEFKSGARILTQVVAEPEHYGVLYLDNTGKPSGVKEKPKNPESNLAITGLYIFDSLASEVAKFIRPSERGELEITSLIDFYLKRNQLTHIKLSRGSAWLDTGNPKSLHDASTYVRVIEERTGQKIACLEEIGFNNGWLNREEVIKLSESYGSSSYGEYLRNVAINSL
jgi:glucose-1-phosphate thymidylyltransferase